MTINGLGFTASPFYLSAEFYEGKVLYRLIGASIKSEYLNDDALSCILDAIYDKCLHSVIFRNCFSYYFSCLELVYSSDGEFWGISVQICQNMLRADLFGISASISSDILGSSSSKYIR